MSAGLMARARAHVEAETAGIRADPAFDLATSNLRKARLLAELRRAGAEPDGAADAEALKAALNENAAELSAQLAAVREITTLITRSIRSHESDGTYGGAFRA